MKAEIKNNTIIITLPIAPRPSKSGKTIVIASTNGNKLSDLTHNGKPVTIGVNAYIQK